MYLIHSVICRRQLGSKPTFQISLYRNSDIHKKFVGNVMQLRAKLRKIKPCLLGTLPFLASQITIPEKYENNSQVRRSRSNVATFIHIVEPRKMRCRYEIASKPDE